MNTSSLSPVQSRSLLRCIHPLSYTCLLALDFLRVSLYAGFLPLPLSPESFNQDIIVESSAPGPILPATTASMDTGWTNSGYSWYERGYHADWPATGLPAPGAVLTSDLAPDHQYQLAPDYRSNNVALIDSSVSRAELSLLAPASYSGLSLLLSGMHQSAVGELACTIFHQDGSSQLNILNCPDWLNRGYSAYSAQGRVDVQNFTFAQLNGGVPQLFTADLILTNRTSPVVRIELRYFTGVRTAVFAVSGSSVPGGSFDPIPVSGYNADIIVEATAVRPHWLNGVTTASMETGVNNTLRTWFEQGYVSTRTVSGLPHANTVLTNQAAPDYLFMLASSYDAPNAVLLDDQTPASGLALLVPALVRQLSFLTASANGPTTNRCVLQFADGSSETNAVVSPDWMSDAVAPAWSAGGRVNLDNRFLDFPASNGPNLYAAEIDVLNNRSALTNVWVTILNPSPGRHTAIFALSGRSGGDGAVQAVLSLRPATPGAILIESTQPGTLESTPGLPGTWTDEGPITSSRTLPVGTATRFWRLRQ